MNTYRTMTVNGDYGSSYLAASDEEATAKAAADGYTVLDITELNDDFGMGVYILVIRDDDGPREPADPAYEAYCEAELARGELAGVAETAECYECCGFDGIHFEIRKIVALGPVVEAHRDPTQSYKLECGHTTI
jgi:hypothetical protein